ncbi:MAG: TonB-dependent receptor [Fimbriimonas sp.]|nr:TonB-dependent receptor [Fimbriimonas sp.]
MMVLGLVLFVGSQAFADVVGRLQFTVKNADDDTGIAGAKIVISDPTNVSPPVTLSSDLKGVATSGLLLNHAWTIKVSSDSFDIDTRTVTVVADVITPVEVLMEPLKEKVITVKGSVNVTRPNNPNVGTLRDVAAMKVMPVAPSNNQSLKSLIQTAPGMVSDSVGQLHPEGEHSSTSIYLNGFQLPGAFQGRFGQILSPTTVQNAEILTGSFAPEYGRETAAILNIQLRSGTIDPFLAFTASTGSWQTNELGLTAGGQFGKEYGAPNDSGRRARSFSYLLSFDDRQTNNAQESPQPDDQIAHNAGQSYIMFANLGWRLSDNDNLSLTLSDNPGTVEIANRTGLSSFYTPYGQGYGFLGLDPASSGLPSQQAAGQDDYQQDHNEFGVLNFLHTVDSHTQARMSLGLTHNGLDILNHNPAIDLNNLPQDNSIEFNPTLIRNARDAEAEGSITSSLGAHTLKAGFSFDRQTGLESYQLTPGSIAALNFLNDPNNGLQQFAPVNGVSSVVTVSRDGWYNAGYVQDTWHVDKRLTANYGLRLDEFSQDQATAQNGGAGVSATSGLNMVEPRVNFAYELPSRTVARASYNKLMIIPPSAQGAVPGAVVPPEVIDQFDTSIEKQTGPGESLKVRYYLKEITNQLDTGLLVAGTQIGAFVTDSIPKDYVRGFEVSYNLFPVHPFGLSAYASYANSTAKPQGNGNDYNDHDQLHTVSVGTNYTFKSGAQIGLVDNYGSGVASSVLSLASTGDEFGSRHAHNELNFRLASAPNFIGRGNSLVFEVQNLFDERALLNFNSGFSGTRFQMGRTIMLSCQGKL